jgi:hypothetical protein
VRGTAEPITSPFVPTNRLIKGQDASDDDTDLEGSAKAKSAGLRTARVAPGMRMGRFWAGVVGARAVVEVVVLVRVEEEEEGWAVMVAEETVLEESVGVSVSLVLKVEGRAGPSIWAPAFE